MDLNFTAEELAFREEARHFFRTEIPQSIRDKVAALKASGASEQEAVAKRPTADFDPIWSKGFFVNGDVFTGLVYRTL